VSHFESSREITLLKNLADYFLICLISAYPRSCVDSELVAADILLKREDYEGALMHLDALSQVGADNIEFAGKKAEVYRAMGKPALAIPFLESAAALRGNSGIRRELAEAYEENGEFIKAVAEYEKLLSTEADPNWVRQQIVNLTRQKLLVAESLSKSHAGSPAVTMKRPDALLLIPPNSRCAIVEKESQTLSLYHSTAQGCGLEKTFACSTGVQQGEKFTQGDERTPEGVYLLRMVLPWTELSEIYGRKAITLDYPNAFDRVEGKTGDGIWLHASNESIRPYLPNKTHGCIVVSNEDIEQISNLIALNQTPLVIVPKIRYRPDAELNAELDGLKNLLAEWRAYWERKELNRYISLYSKRFQNGNENVADWKSHKEGIFSRAGKIRLCLELQSVVQDERYAILTFHQNYHSDRLASQGTKRLFVVNEPGGGKIIVEEMLF
jgi:murein L,D-transpeptidase YafK